MPGRNSLQCMGLMAFVVLAGTVTFGCTILLDAYTVRGKALDSLGHASILRDVLGAADKLRAERAPMDLAIAEDGPIQVEALARLQAARQQTDVALNHLAAQKTSVSSKIVDQMVDELEETRHRVDLFVGKPLQMRSPEEMGSLIDRMNRYLGRLAPVTARAAARLVDSDPEQADIVANAVLLSRMRNDAGSLATLPVPSIAVGRPIQPAELDAATTVINRLNILATTLDQMPYSSRAQSVAPQTLLDIKEIYFGRGIPFIQDIMRRGSVASIPGLNTSEMWRTYVPMMKPIEVLRDLYVDRITAVAMNRLETAEANLRWNSVGLVVILLAGTALGWTLNREILKPLLGLRRTILALSEGRMDVTGRYTGGLPQMVALDNALNTLWERQKARDAADRERLNSVRRLSETDVLTGMLNRRGLTAACAMLDAEGKMPKGVIVLDIDHFKSINDAFGHAGGDRVLTEIGRIVRQELGEGAVFGRRGGEEFAVASRGAGLSEMIAIAERLRRRFERNVFRDTNGVAIAVTCSFGVATSADRDTSWEELIEEADVALYQAKLGGRNRVEASGLHSLSAGMRLAG